MKDKLFVKDRLFVKACFRCFRELTVFAIMLALATELLIPVAYASNDYPRSNTQNLVDSNLVDSIDFQAPVILPGAAPGQGKYVDGCYVSDMSESDRLKWWSLTSRFQAQEVSGMTLNQLKRNKVGERPKGLAPEVMTYDLRQVAQLLGMKPRDVAKELGKSENDALTEGDILYLQSLKKRPSLLADLQRLIGKAPEAEVEYAPYETYKFTMVGPEGKAVSLKELLEMYPIERGNCELGSQEIRGKVNYAAVLNRDLRMGYEKSQETIDYNGSHWTTSEATSSFGEISGNVVIPEMYKRYIIDLGHWTYIDNIVTIFGGIAAYTGASTLEKELASTAAQRKSAQEFLQSLPRDFKPEAIPAEHLTKVTSDIKSIVDKLPEADKITIEGVEYVKTQSFVAQQYGDALMTGAKGLTEAAKKNAELSYLNALKQILASRAALTFYMSMTWLGPARYAVELADGYFFRMLPTKDPKLFNQYIHVYASGKPLAEFKKATDFTVVGDIFDTASSYLKMGVPPKAFEIGPLVVTNEVRGKTQETISTKLSIDGNEWRIRTDWPTDAVAGLFEDIRKQEDYSSMTVFTKNLGISTRLNRKALNPVLYKAISVAAPFLAWRLIGKEAVPSALLVFAQLMWYDFLVHNFVNPHEWSPDDTCKQEIVDGYLNWYKAWVYFGWAEIVGYAFAGPFLKTWSVTANMLNTVKSTVPAFARVLPTAALTLDPSLIGKVIMANKGFEYLGSCKDIAYTIAAYQKLEKGKRPSAYNATIEKTGLSKALEQLKLGSLLKSVGEKLDEARLKEVMSFKSAHKGQEGLVSASELIYLYADPDSTTAWRDFYSNLTKCLGETFVGRDGTAWMRDGNGWRLVNITTGSTIDSFAGDEWKERALFSQVHAGLSRALTPNKVITTPSLQGCGSAALQINGNGAIAAACPACVSAAVSEVTGVTSDLGAALGRVIDISTSEFSGTIRGNVARFYRTLSGAKNETPGEEVRVESAVIQVAGDLTVKIVGGGKETSVGRLNSLTAEYGHVEVVPSTGQLKVFVKTLALANQGNVKDITVGSNPNALFTINNVVPLKPEDKEFTEKLQKALEKIQAGVGFQSLETEKMRYDLLKDEKGNPILRVTNKETGVSTDYKVTGPIRKEGADVIIPTEKGDFRFTIGSDAGRPVVSVSGPDGIKEVLAALLAARGPGGILAFDPKTGNWYAFNAQDLPMNPNFAKNGISWFGGPDGAKGLPTENLFAVPRAKRETAVSPLGPFAFPSFAEGLLGAAMVAAILAGVLAVRVKAVKKRGHT